MSNIPKISLLKRDTRTRIKKISDTIFNDSNNLESKQNKPIKFNHDPKKLINQMGIGNIFQGTRDSLNYQKNIYQKNKQLKEQTMSIKIPIKQIILEFTADQFRDNANKASAATWLGLGGVGGYLAAGGEIHNPFSHPGTLDHPTETTPGQTSPNIKTDSNEMTIKVPTAGQHHVNYNTGEGGSLMDHIKQYGEDQSNIENHQRLMNAVNAKPNPNWLEDKITDTAKSYAIPVGIGAAGLGSLALASRLKRKK